MDHRAGSSSFTPTGEGRSDTPGSSSFPEGTSDIPDQGSARRDPRVSAGLTRLRCSGSDSFDPHSAVEFIKEVFKSSGWNRATISWGDATPAEHTRWFEIFSASYTWDPSEHQAIYKRFKMVASRRLRSIMSKARTKWETKGDRPKWIGDDIWRGMCAKWATEHAASIRDTNRANRAQSNALYYGGSISTTQHLEKLKQRGEDSSAVSLFDVTHTKKSGQGRGQLVDERAQTTRAAFTERMTQYQSQDDGTGATPVPDTYVVWGEVAGVKKGRVYGMGSEASSATPGRRSRSQSQSASDTSAEVERMRLELEQAREREDRLREEAREREERLREEASQREERMMLELERVQQRQEEWERRQEAERREQAERYARLEQLLLSMSSGRGTPLQPSTDDYTRPSDSGASRGSPVLITHDDISTMMTSTRPPAPESSRGRGSSASGSSRGRGRR